MRNIKVSHSGVFLYDKEKDGFVVKVSRGVRGVRIPPGFAKLSSNNPIVTYFTEHRHDVLPKDYLISTKIKSAKRRYVAEPLKAGFTDYLKDLDKQLSLCNAEVFIPGFFRNDLIGILFLGGKLNRKSFGKEELGFLSVLGSDVIMAIQNAWLIEDLNNQVIKTKKIFFDAINALGAAIETKDHYTGGHTARVVTYAIEIAENLKTADIPNWSEFKDNIIVAGLLHDIGKIGIPEKILNKKTSLTDKEMLIVQKHPEVSMDILDPFKDYGEAISGIKYHHERYDGTGYPFSLKGDDIPLIASIIAVADAYDAMTTDRPYRKAMQTKEAIEEIRKNRGKQFHPRVVDAFLKAKESFNPQ